MSKLQKALQKLRNGDEKEPNKQRPSESDGGHGYDSVLPQTDARLDKHRRPAIRVRTQNLVERDTAAGKLPEVSITVDLEALRDHGLRPHVSHLDLVAQQFRRIKRPILNTAFGVGVPEIENANVIMLASSLPGTGKTFCSFNLAVSIAREKDVNAILVDADVLKPNISHAFGVQDRPGLIDYLLNSSLTLDDIIIATDVYDIILVPTGQQHDQATELLASRRMKQFVESLSRRFPTRAIIVDTPPLLLTNEAQVLAEHMGQIVVVIKAGESTQDTVIQALSSLDRDKPINAILNKARRVSHAEYGGYGYYSPSLKGGRNE